VSVIGIDGVSTSTNVNAARAAQANVRQYSDQPRAFTLDQLHGLHCL
jgi:hypothetical protein